jgi:catechol 2,3-dioxygenase-like lactoylglutathione lyase family enzyme
VSNTTAQTSISQVGTMIIPVADQDQAIEFYVEKLGFEKRTDMPFGDGDRWVEVAPPGAATTVALAIPPEGKPVSRFGDPVPPMFWFSDPDGNRHLVVQRA